MSLYVCPVCRKALEIGEKSWVCPNRHSFDRAKSGYVNLLPPSGKSNHGDDRDMVLSRRAFLESGGYSFLRDEVCRIIRGLPDRENTAVLDAGCGEGYYTAAIYQTLCERAHPVSMAAVDISKNAAALAAKALRQVSFAAASVYALPMADASLDLITLIFSPLADGEYHRVLRDGGYLLYVVPLPEHLFSLKAILYENPYLNPLRETALPGFRLVEQSDIKKTLVLNQEQISALFTMTPYYHKTSPEDRTKITDLSSLTTEAAFRVLLYQKGE